MVKAHKFIPFALAAGMMAGTAQAQSTVRYERFPDDAFGCTQAIFEGPRGISRYATSCPNVTGSVLIANHARARMDWGRAFAENEKILAAGIKEKPVVEGLLESALMRGRLDESVWAANVAAIENVVTPQSMLINAVRAARVDDVQGMLSELLYLPVDGGDPANLYVNNLAYTVESAIRSGAQGDAMEILTKALADTEAMIGEQVAQVIAQEGAAAAPFYAPFTDTALLLRRGTEVLAEPENDEARRALARHYIARDADEAAAEILDGIPQERQTAEDRGLRRMAGGMNAPDAPRVVVPIPVPIPR